jgi:hypothetical protein
MCRQLEPQVAPPAQPDAEGPCTPGVVPSAERSCAASEAAQLRDALEARSPKPPEELRLKPEQVAASPFVPEVRSRVRPQSALMLAEAPQLDERD